MTPLLYVIHVFIGGGGISAIILLRMRDGTSSSHGLIDFVLLSGNSSRIWLFPLVGIAYGLAYYRPVPPADLVKLNLNTPGRDIAAAETLSTGMQ